MELMALGFSPSQRPAQGSSPEPEPIKKKKRSREEKEARKEAKKARRESETEKAAEQDHTLIAHEDAQDDPVIPENSEEKKESKEEKAKRKAEKAERKAKKVKSEPENTQPTTTPNGESSKSKSASKSKSKSKEQVSSKMAVPPTEPPKSKAKQQVSSKVAVPPIEPPTQVKKRERSQTTPLVSLSQAGGPSTPKKPSIITARAVRPPSTTPNTRKTPSQSKDGTSKRRGSENKIDDMTLKARLTDQKAVEEYLASDWISDVELRRLERQGVLQYKKGKFTEDERIAVRQVLDTYKKVHKLSEDQLIDIVMCSTTTFPTGRDEWRAFWLDLAAVCPGRPGRYVMKMVQRMYDPRGHKGHFTPEEDAMLVTAYELHPNQWAKIADIVERTYNDCRDRYTKELQHRNTKSSGAWTVEEEKNLLESIKKMNRSLGREELESDGIPWNLVVKEMGGTRTSLQCRKKWTDEIFPKISWGWEKGYEHEDFLKLIKRLEILNYPSEKHINWKDVQDDSLRHMTTHQIRQMYYRLRNKVAEANSMPFPDLVKELNKAAVPSKFSNKPNYPSKRKIDISDSENELEEEEQAGKEEPPEEKDDSGEE